MSDRYQIKKNSNDFSFTSVIIDEVNNLQFKEGSTSLISALSSHSDPYIVKKDGYIWYALSATAEDVGETIYQNVLNYMQNVADIDTCTTKALQSMVQILGTNYSVLDGISSIPLELMNLIDIFSIRKDCLLDSSIMSKQARDYFKSHDIFKISEISDISTLSSNVFVPSAALTGICISSNADNLDNFISSAYVDVISGNLNITYDLAKNDFPIYRYLSNEILSGNFILPNKYKDKIEAYKTKWKIPADFDPEEEMEKIEFGLSTYQDYDARRQDLLSIEAAREAAPKDETQSRTKYAYFKEKKVKEYFNFVELWYNTKNQHYENSHLYDVDNNYIELSSSNSTEKLLDTDGMTLKSTQITNVAEQLLQLTLAIRNLREYLKSHAQRTYMKGTFLLMSYLVNEYLKSLTESKGLVWKQDDNQLNLVEYVDQTQYYNIKADNIEEDQLSIGENTTDRAKQLNDQFWKDGSTAAGNATFVDTTSIVRTEDKSKIVQNKTFSLEQIADFYQNVLGALQDKDSNLNLQSKTYDFLSTVFATGADDTWWSNEYSKVMTTLTNGRKTKDIEKYLADLATYHNEAQYILANYTPIYGTTLQQQLENAKDAFINKIKQKYEYDIAAALSYFDEQLDLVQQLEDEFEQLKDSFDNFTLRLETFINSNMIYTESFVKDSGISYMLQLSKSYYDYVLNNIYNNTIRGTLLQQTTNYSSEHNMLLTQLKNMLLKYDIKTSIELNEINFYPKFNEHIDAKDINLSVEIKLDKKPIITNENRLTTLEPYKNILNVVYFEQAYERINRFLIEEKLYLNSQKAQIQSLIEQYKNEHFQNIQIKALDQLSMQLGLPNYDYLQNSNWLITTCISDIQNDLNYEDDAWYKYKKQLFLKYTGQEFGDTPYYYPQNTIHPSYQIHPCLSNFIEKVDYVYPIQNLAGIAESALKQETQRFLDGELSSLIDKGYLKEIWRNPLNSNQDYLTRYEKADHHDATLSDNEFFGWDGFIHPTAEICCFDHANNQQLKPLTAVIGDTCVSNMLYHGQNYSLYDKKQFEYELSTSKQLLQKALNTGNIDIKQYGLDIYGNSYMLVSQKIDSSNALSNVLWFRRKNMPIPTLAFVCGSDKKYSIPVENHQYSNGVFQMHDYANTAICLSAEDSSLVLATDDNGISLSTPTFDDFVFSSNHTSLYLRKGNRIYYADIVQQLLDAEYVGYKRYALQDLGNRSEYIESDKQFRAWYFNGQEVGGIYSTEKANPTNSNNLDVKIEVVKRINNYIYGQMPHMILSTTLPNVEPDKVKYACDAEGNIALAYVRGSSSSARLSANKQINTSTNTENKTINDLTTYVDLFTTQTLAVQNIQSIGNSLRLGLFAEYAPNADIGFMLAKEGTNNITLNQYGNELEENGFLKVQLAVPEINKANGIDFRRVCPIRVSENDHKSGTDTTKYSGTIDSNTYHVNSSGNFVALSGVVNTNINVHFLESVYNQYVQQETDEQWYELTDEERLGRKHPDSSKNAGNFDYLQLAHYDVMKHLSVLKDEQSNDNLDYLATGLTAKSLLGIIQPYMMISSSVSSYIPNTYLSGFYCTNDANNNPNKVLFTGTKNIGYLVNQTSNQYKSRCVLKIKDINNKSDVYSDISVDWMLLNDKVKLDFNAALYLPGNINSILSVNVNSNPTFNERNKRNLFLNLDRPGEAGILNVYANNGNKLPILRSVWYIKNISEGNVPKFILRSIADNSPTESQIIAFNQFNLKSAKGKNSQNLTLIATEDPILSYISFE